MMFKATFPLKYLSIFIVATSSFAMVAPAQACTLPKSYYKHVSCTSNNQYFLAVKDSGLPVALINKRGKEVVNLTRYAQVDPFKLNEGVMPVQRAGKVGYVNLSGREVVPAIYDIIIGDINTVGWARSANNNRIVVKKNGKFGIIDLKNNIILPFSSRYQRISDYTNHTAKVTKSSGTITIDKNARVINDPALASRSSKPTLQAAKTTSNSVKPTHNPIISNYEPIVNPNYDSIENSKLSIESLSGSSSQYNNNMSTIINDGNNPTFMQNEQRYVENWQAKKRDGKWGFVDSSGVPMITFSFDQVTHYSEGLAGVKMDGKWGFINLKGDLVIPFKYDDSTFKLKPDSINNSFPAFTFIDGVARVGINDSGKTKCINVSGKEIACGNLNNNQHGSSSSIVSIRNANSSESRLNAPSIAKLNTTTIYQTIHKNPNNKSRQTADGSHSGGILDNDLDSDLDNNVNVGPNGLIKVSTTKTITSPSTNKSKILAQDKSLKITSSTNNAYSRVTKDKSETINSAHNDLTALEVVGLEVNEGSSSVGNLDLEKQSHLNKDNSKITETIKRTVIANP